MKIILVRHGQSTANKERIRQGHLDYPLSELGEQQAAELGQQMKKEKFLCQGVYSSDLSRASKTAEIITEILELEVTKYDKRLREMHLGDHQGKKNDDLTIEDNLHAEKVWKNHEIKFPNGESVNDMNVRVREAFDEIVESHKESDTVLIIAHGGTLFQIISHILNLFPETDEWFSNCSYNELVRVKKSNPWQLTMFNGKKL